MENLQSFRSFVNEAESHSDISFSDAEKRIKEIRKRVYAQSPEERLNQTAHDEGGALRRLAGEATQGIIGLKNGIADLFNTGKVSSMSDEELAKNRKEVLSKWGEDIKKIGKNKDTNYEEFYKDAIIKGKRSFGRTFDIEKPKSKQESLYTEYVNDATKYFEFK